MLYNLPIGEFVILFRTSW